jgi:hypothetical protein
VFVECFGRRSPAEGFAWSAVERVRDRLEVVAGVPGEVGAPGEVLAKQSVGVLVRPALPGALRVAEVDRETGVDAQLGVLSHLGALVPGQRSSQLFGERRDRGGDRVADGFRAVPGECRPVLCPWLPAVAVHTRVGCVNSAAARLQGILALGGWVTKRGLEPARRVEGVPLQVPPEDAGHARGDRMSEG